MFRVLLLLFIILPIIEIALIINVGSWLGFWPTLLVIILTAWIGAKKVRQQGINTMNSVQTKLAQGEMPSDDIITGMMLLVSGVLLVTPGFITDIFGLSLLWPASRNAIISQVKKHIKVENFSAGATMHGQSFNFHQPPQQPTNDPFDDANGIQKGKTLDGEFERKD